MHKGQGWMEGFIVIAFDVIDTCKHLSFRWPFRYMKDCVSSLDRKLFFIIPIEGKIIVIENVKRILEMLFKVSSFFIFYMWKGLDF